MVNSKILTKKVKTKGSIGDRNELVKLIDKDTELIVLVNSKKSKEVQKKTESQYRLFSGTVIYSDTSDWEVGDFSEDWSRGRFKKVKGRIKCLFENKTKKKKSPYKISKKIVQSATSGGKVTTFQEASHLIPVAGSKFKKVTFPEFNRRKEQLKSEGMKYTPDDRMFRNEYLSTNVEALSKMSNDLFNTFLNKIKETNRREKILNSMGYDLGSDKIFHCKYNPDVTVSKLQLIDLSEANWDSLIKSLPSYYQKDHSSDSYTALAYAIQANKFIKDRTSERIEILEKEGWGFAKTNDKNHSRSIPIYRKEGRNDITLQKIQYLSDSEFKALLVPSYEGNNPFCFFVFKNIINTKEPDFNFHCDMNEEVWNALLRNGYHIAKNVEGNGDDKTNSDYKYIQVIPIYKKFYPIDEPERGSSELMVDDVVKAYIRSKE
jgi:hypothetical protein